VLLCYLEGKTHNEGAQQLGWSLTTFRGRLERGRDVLRKRLTQRGVTLSGALLATVLSETAASAAVSGSFLSMLIKGALASETTKGVVSAQVLSLAKGVMQTMFWNKLKIGVAAVLLAVITVGVGGFALQDFAGDGQAQALSGVVQGKNPEADLAKTNIATKEQAGTAAKQKDLDALQGKWRVERAEANGKKIDDEAGNIVIIKGNTLDYGDEKRVAPFEIDPTTKPKSINLKQRLDAFVYEGIYKIEGDTLVLCLSKDIGEERKRPSEFSTKPGSLTYLIVLKRISEEKKEQVDEAKKAELLATAQELKDGKIKELLKERLDVLKGLVKVAETACLSGTMTYADLAQANARLTSAELELCTTDKERLAVLEAAVAVARGYEKVVEQQYNAGRATQASVLNAKANRLETEIAVERAKAKMSAKPK
jgi:uncharacterized protein (TIGR03067 family)